MELKTVQGLLATWSSVFMTLRKSDFVMDAYERKSEFLVNLNENLAQRRILKWFVQRFRIWYEVRDGQSNIPDVQKNALFLFYFVNNA
jgi:hypothetical protein